jgi:Trk K+ transport system NAD-binding subunit
VFGTDQLARLIATRLRNAGEPVTFVSRDGAQLDALAHQGFAVVRGNPAQESVLLQAGATNARALIAVPTVPDIVVDVCRLARERFSIPQIVARIDDAQVAQRLQALDVRVIQPSFAVALALEGALLYPATYDMLLDQSDNVELLDVHVRNGAVAGVSLRKLRLPGDVLILGVRRQGEVIVPHGDTILQLDDVLMLVGSPNALKETQTLISGARQTGILAADP